MTLATRERVRLGILKKYSDPCKAQLARKQTENVWFPCMYLKMFGGKAAVECEDFTPTSP